MSDRDCIYSRKELEKLDKKARDETPKGIKKQIEASREIRAMIYAHAEVKKILKEKLRDT